MPASLKGKISKKTAQITVIGLGYVGLPIAARFAKAGFSVLGLDKDADRVRLVNQKKSYISDVPTRELASLVRSGNLRASDNFSLLQEANVIIICVPTPLKRKYTPDISFILSAVQAIRKNLKGKPLVVLESTTYPGTTKEIILPLLEKGRKKIGRDFYLAFSPERIDPGNKTYPVHKIPKIVGGVNRESGLLTKSLYETIIKEVHLVSSAKAAEMTKLLENSFRIINIGWINEVTMMCHKMGIDVWEVIDAAKTKPFGFMPFYPGLGVGGHCIPDDPLYLYWKAKVHGFNSKYLKLSSDTNSSMPAYAVSILKKALPTKKKKKIKIFVIGVTYKKDVKDLRKSPPLVFIELLQEAGFEVSYFDPLIPYLKIGKIDLSVSPLSGKNLKQSDCVVIATDHSSLNYSFILSQARLVFDIRNVYAGRTDKKILTL